MPGSWGAAIKQLRLKKGWTKAVAAKKSDMTPTTYGRIEAGGHTRTRKLQGIAEAFSVPLEAVLHLQLSGWIEATQQRSQTDDITQLKTEILALRREIAQIRAGQAEPTVQASFDHLTEVTTRQNQQRAAREAASQKRAKRSSIRKKGAK